jgi:hypothetical protein
VTAKPHQQMLTEEFFEDQLLDTGPNACILEPPDQVANEFHNDNLQTANFELLSVHVRVLASEEAHCSPWSAAYRRKAFVLALSLTSSTAVR